MEKTSKKEKLELKNFLKYFLRPTKGKILLFFILVLLGLYFFIVLLNSDCFGDCRLWNTFIMIFSILFLIIPISIQFMFILLDNIGIFDGLSNYFWLGKAIALVLFMIVIIIELIYLYVLSCLITFMFKKFMIFIRNVKNK